MKRDKLDYWEILYLVFFAFICARDFITTTMIQLQLPRIVNWGVLCALVLFTGIKLFWSKKYNMQETIFGVLIVGCFGVAGIISTYHFLIYLGCLIVAAEDVDFRKILIIYVVIAITILLIAFVASEMGYIEKLDYPSARNGGIRHSFGVVYPTDFAAHVFYLILAILALNIFKGILNKTLQVLIPIGGALFVYKQCDAITSTICLMVMSALFVLGFIIQKTVVFRRFVVWISSIAYLVGAIVFIAMGALYTPGKPVWDKLNQILSLRLQFSNDALKKYPIKIFGQPIEEYGLGGKVEGHITNFFIDDSYLKILLEYGVVCFGILMIIFLIINKKLIENKQDILLLMMVAIAIHSFMEHHLIEIVYNPFILLLFARIEDLKGKQTESLIEKAERG